MVRPDSRMAWHCMGMRVGAIQSNQLHLILHVMSLSERGREQDRPTDRPMPNERGEERSAAPAQLSSHVMSCHATPICGPDAAQTRK